MNPQHIKVRLNLTTGITEILVEGIKGEGCRELTRELEDLLGCTTAEEPTEEYYQTEQALETQK